MYRRKLLSKGTYLMNRKIMTVMAALLMASAFTGCGAKETDAPDAQTETTIQQTEQTETASAEDISDDTDDTAPDEGASEEAVSDNPLYPVIENVLSQVEWPFMMEVTDEVILKEFFLLDPADANYNGLIVMQCPMSAAMSEIIVIDAADTDAAKADLEARRTKAIETDAWYPNDHILAEASIVGTTGNYAYFIIGEEAANTEPLLTAALNG